MILNFNALKFKFGLVLFGKNSVENFIRNTDYDKLQTLERNFRWVFDLGKNRLLYTMLLKSLIGSSY